jgi:hypothetical protein
VALSDDQIREELLDEIVGRIQAAEPPDHAIRSALANVRERVVARPAETPQVPGLDTGTRRQPRAGTSPLTRRIFRIGVPAAIAAAVLLAVGLWPESGRKTSPGGAGRVYALSDIPELLRSAKVLHLHGWASGDQRVKLVRDYWLDAARGRWHVSHTVADLVEGSSPSEELKKQKNRGRQWIFDGEYRMALSYEVSGAPGDPLLKTTADFTRLTPFRRNLERRRYYEAVTENVAGFDDARALGLFARVGRETVDGIAFEIWESQQDMGSYDKPANTVAFDGQNLIRIKVWLSPKLGVLGRVEKWVSNPKTQGAWVLGEVAEKIERDVAPPPGIFDTVPPAGCTLKNTRETARLDTLDTGGYSEEIGDWGLRYHAGFNLGDGTILLGWRSQARGSTESQAPLFQDLLPGGPLPKLPIVIHTLVPQNPACPITYTGRHLAWTQKGSRFFEWSLFVPDKDLTLPEDRCTGNLDIRYSLTSATAGEQKPLHYGGDWVAADTRIKDPADFQELVVAAMGELSDDGAIPEGITYEYVMSLSRQIRESLGRP